MPFGFGPQVGDWDILFTDEQLEDMFSQFRFFFLENNHWVAFLINVTDFGRMSACMVKHGYKNIEAVYVYKPQQNTKGTNQFIGAVEVVIIGWKPNQESMKVHFKHSENNPVLRHNLLFSPQVSKKFQSGVENKPVNSTQKHPWVCHKLGLLLAEPGSTVIVAGAGSGSDVLGFIRANCSVIAVEKDPMQFKHLSRRLMEENTESKAIDNDVKWWIECVDKMKEITSHCANLCDEERKTEKEALKKLQEKEKQQKKEAMKMAAAQVKALKKNK